MLAEKLFRVSPAYFAKRFPLWITPCFFCIWIQHVHTISLPPLSVMQLFVDTLYTNIGKSFWKKKLIFSQFACIGCEVVDCSCGRVSNICCFSCPHMKVILIRAGEKLQNFRWCSVFRIFEQGGIFIVPHVSEHGTPVLRSQPKKKTPAPI